MQSTALVGIDLGKQSFHLHGQDARGKALWRKKLNRKQLTEFFATLGPCTVVMEACAGAHWMARKLTGFGHEAKLISPQFVRPFVKGNKNDFVDAEAICEAASRPSMRFVSPRTETQQTLSALHRVRESFIRDRTRAVNQIHGFLLEFGISLPTGMAVIKRLPVALSEHTLPPRMVAILEGLHSHVGYLSERIAEIDKEMSRQLAEDDLGQRLLTMPGVGPVTASNMAVAATLPPRWDWSHASTAPVARPTCWASANAATRTFVACWCSVREVTCSALTARRGNSRTGCDPCCYVDIPTSWPARWPTNWRVSPGPWRPGTPNSIRDQTSRQPDPSTALPVLPVGHPPGFAIADIG